MVTAVKEIQAASKAIKLGAYEYIVKPFVVDEVQTLIQRILENRNRVLKNIIFMVFSIYLYF